MIFQRLSIAAVSGKPWEDFQLNHLVFAFSVAACFADPIVSRPLRALRELDPAHFRSAIVGEIGQRINSPETRRGSGHPVRDITQDRIRQGWRAAVILSLSWLADS